MKALIAVAAFATLCSAQDAQLRSWVMTTSINAAALDVHKVHSDDRFVYVESAGLSLHSFGRLEANQYDPPPGRRAFSFRIPRHPKPGAVHLSAPLGIIGVFVTGVPIYNPIGTSSYQDQNIWHRDAVAAETKASPLLTALTTGNGRHSPVIGFALDGYPVYGPFGRDPEGNVRRMKSSYRLRAISRRTTLPDGTILTPAQDGPAVGAEFPAGFFAEDYEYAPGSGDLDGFNGRFAITPEYPEGVYAYYLASADSGAIAWPYLAGPRYYGDAPLDVPSYRQVGTAGRVDLRADRARIQPGEAVSLDLVFHDGEGRVIRFLEKVHQQPVHLIVVSRDLSEFDHIHPEPVAGDSLAVAHTFAHGGEYWLYADYTAPGEPPSVARFAVTVEGEPRKPVPLHADTGHTKTIDGVRIEFAAPQQLSAGQDLPLSFKLTNAENNQPVADLEPWLGAWGHIMIVGEDGRNFIHAHPLDGAAPETTFIPHTHAAVIPGPSPQTIRTVTGFRSPGVYKLWLQFQRHGQLITVPWVMEVRRAGKPAGEISTLPAAAIRVMVSSAGFAPSRLEIPAGKPAQIAFTRSDAQNCAGEVVFPELGIRRALPPGQAVVIDLPAGPPREMAFACGMGMFRGALVVR